MARISVQTAPERLVYRQGGVAKGNVFTSWAALAAKALSIPGPKEIYVDHTGSPDPNGCHVPAGAWDLGFGATFLGDIAQVNALKSLIFDNGATLVSIPHEFKFVYITSNSATPVCSGVITSNLLIFLEQAAFDCTGGAPLISVTGAGTLFFGLFRGTYLAVQGSTSAIFRAGAGGIIVIGADIANVSNNTLQTTSGGEIDLYQASPAALLSTVQLGTTFLFLLDLAGNVFYDDTVALLGVGNVQAAIDAIVLRLPTASQKLALLGTNGTPGNTNHYVTDSDPRNTNARTPSAHASTHLPGGTDALTTAAPVDIGNANALGSATSYPKSDHVHNLPFTSVLTTLGAATSDISVNSHKITNLSTPTSASDAATKGYADTLIQGLFPKGAARVTSTANITLSGTQTIDGVAVVAGNRVLAQGQTTASQNGIYVVAAGAWARSTDLATGSAAAGVFLPVEEGTVNADTVWLCTTDAGSDVVGTNSLAFSKFSTFPLATSAPADVTKAAAAVGTATRAAREDHKHDISTAAPGTIGTANAEGTATSLARSDHTHNHGAQTDGTLHAVAVSAGANGFFLGSDKALLDANLPSAGQKAALPGTSGTPGAGNLYVTNADTRNTNARTPTAHASTHSPGDTDALALGSPVDIGTANAAGTATSYPRSDHVHNLPFTPVQTALGVATGDIGVNNHKLTSVATPTSAADAATKGYVDSVAAGLSPKGSVKYATTGALPAYSYNNGALGIGATITETGLGALPAQDGAATPQVNDRFLVKNETAGNAPFNGIYVVTQVGTGLLPFILTRSLDDNQASEMAGAFVFVEDGTINGDLGFVCAQDSSLVIGTTAITWTQFTGAGEISVLAPIVKTGNQLSLPLVPVANGGTNSSAALNNNRVMQSTGGTIAEAAAITASRALKSDANGIPVASTATAASLDALAGTNTGDVTLGAVGAAPNANAASLAGQTLNLQPASASFPGVMVAADFVKLGALDFRVATGVTASGSGSSVELLVNGVTQVTLANSTSYRVKLHVQLDGSISGTPRVQSFEQVYTVRRTSNVTTIIETGGSEQIGSAEAATWTSVLSIGTTPDRLVLTVGNGTTVSAVSGRAVILLVPSP